MEENNWDNIYEGLKKSLKDFSPSIDPETSLIYSQKSSKFHIGSDEIQVPELIQFIFSNILNYTVMGPGEKLRWQVRFFYENIDATFALEKFGLRLYLSSPTEDQEKLIKIKNEITGKLSRLILKAEKHIFTPFAKHQIKERNFTIANHYHKFENRFDFFRNKATNDYIPEVQKGNESIHELARKFNALQEYKYEQSYYAIAMLDAYFSFLEHLFVLILPIAEKPCKKYDLVQFISSFWSQKYKVLFDVKKNRKAKEFYDQLNELKENFRNYYAHGGFEKNGESLYFHFPGIGALPAKLSSKKNEPHFDFFPIDDTSTSHMIKVIDKFDEWLRSDDSGVKYAVRYAESGLDMPCDSQHIDEIICSMTNIQEFDKLLEKYSHVTDMHDNMDY